MVKWFRSSQRCPESSGFRWPGSRLRIINCANVFQSVSLGWAAKIARSWKLLIPRQTYLDLGPLFSTARPSGILLLAERYSTIDLSARPRTTHNEITVINIVGLAPSQFIAKFCFLQRLAHARSAGVVPKTSRDETVMDENHGYDDL